MRFFRRPHKNTIVLSGYSVETVTMKYGKDDSISSGLSSTRRLLLLLLSLFDIIRYRTSHTRGRYYIIMTTRHNIMSACRTASTTVTIYITLIGRQLIMVYTVNVKVTLCYIYSDRLRFLWCILRPWVHVAVFVLTILTCNMHSNKVIQYLDKTHTSYNEFQ